MREMKKGEYERIKVKIIMAWESEEADRKKKKKSEEI